MADNVTIPATGSGTATPAVATDDVGGAHYQRVKIDGGGDGLAAPIGGDAANGLDVDVTRSALPTGAATSAKQDTIIGHVDGVETLLGTIDADTSALAGAVAGTEVQVDIVSAPTITVESELTTADLDTGAGTDTRAVVGLAGTASGGAQLIPGSSADGLLVNLGANNDVTVSGVATAANQTTVIGHLDGVETTLTAIDGRVDGVEALLTTIDADTSNLSVVGGGTEAAALRVTIASNSTGVLSVDDNGASLTVDGTVTANLAAGTNNIGDVDVLTLPALPAGTNNIGDVDVLSLPATPAGTNTIGAVNVKPATSGGLSIATDIDLDETELEIKATAGQLFGWYIYNDGAAEVYVKLYNATAANVTVGTTVPVMTVGIPAGSGANVEFTNGIAFSTAICAAATTVATTADATPPAANQVVANFLFA